jgi:hypothetical protein
MEVIMDDIWHYIDLVCPICGGKVRHHLYLNICENCNFALPNSNAAQAVLYDINSSGTGIAYGGINPEDLVSKTLSIDCELITLHHKELDIEFELKPEKLENIDIIEINGHRFVRDKK